MNDRKWHKDELCMNKALDIQVINKKITVYNKYTKKTYVIGEREYQVLKNMNGTRTIQELSKISVKYSPNDIEQMVEVFQKMNFLKKVKKKKKSIKDLWKIKVSIVNGNKLLHPEHLFTKIFSFILLYTSIPVFILGCLVYEIKIGFSITMLGQITNTSIITLLLIFWLSAIVHEFSHAVVARRFKIPVPDIGMLFYCLIPYPYTNLTYISLLEKKGEKLVCLLAGIFSNALIAGGSFLVAPFFKQQSMMLILIEIGIVNLAFAITNLMLFFKLDGYFILLTAMDESYLRERTMSEVIRTISLIPERIRKRKNNTTEIQVNYSGNNKMFLEVFGVLSIFYVPVLIIMSLMTGIHMLTDLFG